jgi:hypothetical protein
LADQNLREKESQSVFLSQAFPIPPQDPRKFLFPKQQRFFLAIEHRSDPQEPQSFFLVRGFIIEWKILSGNYVKRFSHDWILHTIQKCRIGSVVFDESSLKLFLSKIFFPFKKNNNYNPHNPRKKHNQTIQTTIYAYASTRRKLS